MMILPMAMARATIVVLSRSRPTETPPMRLTPPPKASA